MVVPRPAAGRTRLARGALRPGSDAARAIGGYAAVAIVAAAVWSSVGGGAPSPAAAANGASPGTVTKVEAGAELFNQTCAACHGADGAGTSNGPDIRASGAALTDFMLRTGRMPLAAPGFQAQREDPAFNADEIASLVAYVTSLGEGPPIPDVVTGGGDVGRGRELYTANCAACHGPAAGGGAVGGGFVAPPLAPASDLEVGEAVVGGPGPMPRFSLDQQSLRDLVAYVAYLRNPPNPGGATAPAVGPVTEGFIAGLVLLALIVVARWIAVRQREAPR